MKGVGDAMKRGMSRVPDWRDKAVSQALIVQWCLDCESTADHRCRRADQWLYITNLERPLRVCVCERKRKSALRVIVCVRVCVRELTVCVYWGVGGLGCVLFLNRISRPRVCRSSMNESCKTNENCVIRTHSSYMTHSYYFHVSWIPCLICNM